MSSTATLERPEAPTALNEEQTKQENFHEIISQPWVTVIAVYDRLRVVHDKAAEVCASLFRKASEDPTNHTIKLEQSKLPADVVKKYCKAASVLLMYRDWKLVLSY